MKISISIGVVVLTACAGEKIGTPAPGAPPARSAWSLHAPQDGYILTAEPDPFDSTREVRRLRAKPDAATTSFGTVMQTFDAERYRGKRVRFSGTLRAVEVAGWAGLWMRVDGPDGRLEFDNMQARSIAGTTPAKRYEVVLDVPDISRKIALGALLAGRGELTLASPSIEIVDPSVPVTTLLPQDFQP